MLTIVIPMAGESPFFPRSEYLFPKVFQEISGKPMIQVVLENLSTIEAEKRFVFIINDADAKTYRLDNVLRMLTNDNCEIVAQQAPTKGAVCTMLLAVKHINHDSPVLISNADQLISHDLNRIVGHFSAPGVDGGVVCFDSVHPQWSYAKVGEGSELLETSEKQPISRNAIAGLYYFARGRDFVESAMTSIVKNRSHDGKYYTSLVLNEMILKNRNLRMYPIDKAEYASFYSPEKINEYEQRVKAGGPAR